MRAGRPNAPNGVVLTYYALGRSTFLGSCEIRRDVLTALRAAQGPMTSLEVARLVIAGRKLPEAADTVIMFRKRLRASL